jgi:hypothetical protein
MNETQQILQKISDLEDKISELTSEVEYLKMLLNVETYAIKTSDITFDYIK